MNKENPRKKALDIIRNQQIDNIKKTSRLMFLNKEQEKEFEEVVAKCFTKNHIYSQPILKFISKMLQQDRDKYIRELKGLKRRLYPEELDNPFYPKEGKKKIEMGANKVHNEIAKEINAEISKLIKKYV